MVCGPAAESTRPLSLVFVTTCSEHTDSSTAFLSLLVAKSSTARFRPKTTAAIPKWHAWRELNRAVAAFGDLAPPGATLCAVTAEYRSERQQRLDVLRAWQGDDLVGLHSLASGL